MFIDEFELEDTVLIRKQSCNVCGAICDQEFEYLRWVSCPCCGCGDAWIGWNRTEGTITRHVQQGKGLSSADLAQKRDRVAAREMKHGATSQRYGRDEVGRADDSNEASQLENSSISGVVASAVQISNAVIEGRR